MDSIPVRIVAETNVIRAQDDRFLFSKNLKRLTEKQAGLSKKIYLAEITVKEVVYQKTKSDEAARQKISSAIERLVSPSKTVVGLGWSPRVKALIAPLRSRLAKAGFGWNDASTEIGAKAKRELSKLKVRILKPKLDKIDWARVIDDAVLRRPPFEGTPESKSEKGFRDAVFVETILPVIRNEPGAYWCILSNDDKVRERLLAEKQADSTLHDLEIFGTVDACENYMKLLLEQFEQVTAFMLPGVATTAFYDSSKNAGLWISESIETKVREQFASVLNAPLDVPSEATNSTIAYIEPFNGSGVVQAFEPFFTQARVMADLWPPNAYSSLESVNWYSSGERYIVIPTESRFVERQPGGRVRWATKIRIYTLFQKPITLELNPPTRVIREISIEAIWSADVQLLALSNAVFEKLEFVEKNFFEASLENILSLGFGFLPTTSSTSAPYLKSRIPSIGLLVNVRLPLRVEPTK